MTAASALSGWAFVAIPSCPKQLPAVVPPPLSAALPEHSSAAVAVVEDVAERAELAGLVLVAVALADLVGW